MKVLTQLVFVILLINSTMAQTKKIIFVCEHGAGKSVVAASYFNKLAKERNLDYVAECRGTNPDSIVSLKTQEGLTKDNVYDANTKPTKLQLSDTTNAERIILFTASSARSKHESQNRKLVRYRKRRCGISKKKRCHHSKN